MINYFRNKVKAQALYFVVTISIVIAILLSSFILNSSVYAEVSDQLDIERKLIWNSKSALNYGLSKEVLPFHEKLDLFGSETDSVEISSIPFGLFHFLKTTVFHGKQSLTANYVVGKQSLATNNTCIYLSESRNSLGVCGATKIIGDVYVPKRGIERSYIEGKSYQNKELYSGKKYSSSKEIPKLLKSTQLAIEEVYLQPDSSKPFPTDSNRIECFEKTEYLLNEPTAIDQLVRGPVIIRSNETITIQKEANLLNTIIVAPDVVVEDGFKGTLQIFATHTIVLGDDVTLEFPSNLIVKSLKTNFNATGITIGEHCNIAGNLAYIQPGSSLKIKGLISIGKESVIKGEVYSNRRTELKNCTIYGEVYTNSFYLKTHSSTYNNQLLDVEINKSKLDSNHISLGLNNSATVWQVI